MSDRWSEERERAWRERARRQAQDARKDPWSYRSERREERTWPTGAEYDDYGSDAYADSYGRDDYGTGTRGGGANERFTDRFYEAQRQPAYREGYMHGATDYGPDQGGYGMPAREQPGRYSNFGFGHDLRGDTAYGPSRSYGGYASAQPRTAPPRQPEEHRGFFDRAGDRLAAWFGADRDHGQDHDRHTIGHRGKGPKGYKRSDARISDDVHDRLTDDPWLDASEIEVAVANGEVTLTGTVTDREAKHRAERSVEHVSGVEHVQNNLRIGEVKGSRPFDGGNPLTSPGRGFGDSILDAQARGESPTSGAPKRNS